MRNQSCPMTALDKSVLFYAKNISHMSRAFWQLLLLRVLQYLVKLLRCKEFYMHSENNFYERNLVETDHFVFSDDLHLRPYLRNVKYNVTFPETWISVFNNYTPYVILTSRKKLIG